MNPWVRDAIEVYESHAEVMHCYRPNGSRSQSRADMYRYACMHAEAASVALDMVVAAAHRPWAGPAWAVTVDDVAYA